MYLKNREPSGNLVGVWVAMNVEQSWIRCSRTAESLGFVNNFINKNCNIFLNQLVEIKCCCSLEFYLTDTVESIPWLRCDYEFNLLNKSTQGMYTLRISRSTISQV